MVLQSASCAVKCAVTQESVRWHLGAHSARLLREPLLSRPQPALPRNAPSTIV